MSGQITSNSQCGCRGGVVKSRMLCRGLVELTAKTFLVFLLVIGNAVCAEKTVDELKKGNIETYFAKKFFILTYVDSTGCSRCRNLYPFYYAAAQSFRRDQDIYFTRTYDKQLIEEWGVTELPALIYHKKGVDPNDLYGKRGVLSADITVDDILEKIEKVLHGDFESIRKRYVVHLDSHNFHEMITTPTQAVMMLLYDKESKENTVPVFEDVANTFRKEDALLVAMLDVDKYPKLRDQSFKVRDSPAFMWFGENDKKTPKRFGGMLTKELMVSFINERTELHRKLDGTMEREAGRISKVDEILKEHADILYDAEPNALGLLSDTIKKLEPKVLAHQKPLLEYYLQVLDEIVKSGGAFAAFEDQVMNTEARIYGDEELSPKTNDLLKKHINILEFFQKIVKAVKNGQWQKSPDRPDLTVTLESQHHALHEEL